MYVKNKFLNKFLMMGQGFFFTLLTPFLYFVSKRNKCESLGNLDDHSIKTLVLSEEIIMKSKSFNTDTSKIESINLEINNTKKTLTTIEKLNENMNFL
jgi:hypothetical protein